VPQAWVDRGSELETWEEWRRNCSDGNQITLSHQKDLIKDYRYVSSDETIDHFFRSAGRVLLGLLSGSFEAPLLWNLRGNEQMTPFPTSSDLQRIAVSSRTLLIIDSCLNRRSDENRFTRKEPSLFGLDSSEFANDTEFDAPILIGPEDLMQEIQAAQEQLQLNQLSVTYQRPRQLIPFHIRDFSAATRDNNVGQPDDQ